MFGKSDFFSRANYVLGSKTSVTGKKKLIKSSQELEEATHCGPYILVDIMIKKIPHTGDIESLDRCG